MKIPVFVLYWLPMIIVGSLSFWAGAEFKNQNRLTNGLCATLQEMVEEVGGEIRIDGNLLTSTKACEQIKKNSVLETKMRTGGNSAEDPPTITAWTISASGVEKTVVKKK